MQHSRLAATSLHVACDTSHTSTNTHTDTLTHTSNASILVGKSHDSYKQSYVCEEGGREGVRENEEESEREGGKT